VVSVEGTVGVMSWRLIDRNGTIKELPGSDIDIEKLRTKLYMYKICKRHRIVCSGKKAHKQHLQQEHSY